MLMFYPSSGNGTVLSIPHRNKDLTHHAFCSGVEQMLHSWSPEVSAEPIRSPTGRREIPSEDCQSGEFRFHKATFRPSRHQVPLLESRPLSRNLTKSG